MAFVKLDTGILDSTLWIDREAREVFITALLMATPFDTDTPIPTLKSASLESADWDVPAGWYGFVKAAGPGIVRRAGINPDIGMAALVRLSTPEPESRSQDFDGRRLVRVDGGFIILNFMKYREKDTTSGDRSRRYREKKKRDAVTPLRHGRHAPSRVDRHQAEAEAEAEVEVGTTSLKSPKQGTRPSAPVFADKIPDMPSARLMAMYNEQCPKLTPVKKLTASRRQVLRARWKEHPDVDWWRGYFDYITNKCPFLSGSNDKCWVADFDFVIKANKQVAIMEGKYSG